MKIRDRLALNFTLISTGMLLFVLCSVYFIFLKFLEADFYARLTDRTMVTAKLYLEADEISRDALNKVRSRYLVKLSDEVIRIYDSKNKATFIGDRAQYWTAEVIDKVRQERKVQFKDGERQVVGIFYKDNQGDFVILASATDQSSHNRLNKLSKIMVATFIIISILLLFSGRWLAKKMLNPLQIFMEEVKKVGSSNLEFRVKETDTKDEINQLAKNFNQLMEELEQAFILQKTFVANASHELRTPITRVMMTAELALAKERQLTDYQKVLESVLEDISKMDHIITGLLTLAKVDLELASSHLSPIRLDEVLITLKEEWKKQHNEELQLIYGPLDQEPLIMANHILLQIALNNIISNAFKFSNQQAVVCTLQSNGQNVQLHIKDQGIGIPTADIDEIFKPFYSRAAQNGQQGEGMGLYMAARIIKLLKGSITVESINGHGSTFILSFPQL